jgi:hypothetical protein
MICSAANALLELFKQAQDTLTDEELKWLSNLDLTAQMESSNLAASLSTLAVSIGSTMQPDAEVLQRILWGLSNQAAITSAIIEISTAAVDLLQSKRDNTSEGGAK